MKVSLSMILAAAAALLGLSSAQAATIVSDSFEYADQAAFEAVWTPIGTVAPLSGELSTAQASDGTKSIRNAGTLTTGQSRNRLTFAETGAISTSNKLTWSFDFYDANGTNSPARNFSNLQDSVSPTGTNQLIAMGLNNNQTGANSGGQFYMARILGYTVPTTADPDGGPAETVGGAGAFFKLNDFGVGGRTTGWHNLKVEISTDDGLSTDYAFYVDGQLAELVSNIGTAASLRSYDNIALGSALSNASVDVFFDNMQLVSIPEPATLALVGMALGAVACTRRRVA
jgi:hypothetical protein